LLGSSSLDSSLFGGSLRVSSLVGSSLRVRSLIGSSFLDSSLPCSYFLSSSCLDSSLRVSSLLGSNLLDRAVSEFEGQRHTVSLDQVRLSTNNHGKTKSTVFRARIHPHSQATKTLFWPMKTSADKKVVCRPTKIVFFYKSSTRIWT